MRKVPEILSAKTVALTRLFRIERIGLRFSNGNEVEYERMPGSTTGAVLIVPVLPPDTALLIREYTAGTHRYELGLPKGRFERG
jgi:ADP-ribose diphosphatase